MDRYNARLVAKDFFQTYGVDYLEILSCALSQLHSHPLSSYNESRSADVPDSCLNTFLYSDLQEVYIKQSPRYVAREECGLQRFMDSISLRV